MTHDRITRAATACGRDPAEIGLLAVSKTKPVQDIETAYQTGQRAFGENYLQEAERKISAYHPADIEWHFIGRIQSNKTAAIARLFDWVHGLCSLKHAERLNMQRSEDASPLQCCIQVNLSGESSKGGLTPTETLALASATAGLPRLVLRGLMTMPDPSAPAATQRAQFRQLRLLRDEINAATGLTLDTLSMGMSGDLELAIAEGATLVRIGTAIFGPRA